MLVRYSVNFVVSILVFMEGHRRARPTAAPFVGVKVSILVFMEGHRREHFPQNIFLAEGLGRFY